MIEVKMTLEEALKAAEKVRSELAVVQADLDRRGPMDPTALAAWMAGTMTFLNLLVGRVNVQRSADTSMSKQGLLIIIDRDLDQLDRFIAGGRLYLSERGGLRDVNQTVIRLFKSVALDLDFVLDHEPFRSVLPMAMGGGSDARPS